mmetsp:Transcript_12609/g.23293  ORF Transcript_12609/g.23293 Transcript_12609/m.23293 type:complete len:245 (-) Transcript_12609:80-814(-)
MSTLGYMYCGRGRYAATSGWRRTSPRTGSCMLCSGRGGGGGGTDSKPTSSCCLVAIFACWSQRCSFLKQLLQAKSATLPSVLRTAKHVPNSEDFATMRFTPGPSLSTRLGCDCKTRRISLSSSSLKSFSIPTCRFSPYRWRMRRTARSLTFFSHTRAGAATSNSVELVLEDKAAPALSLLGSVSGPMVCKTSSNAPVLCAKTRLLHTMSWISAMSLSWTSMAIAFAAALLRLPLAMTTWALFSA